MSYETYAHAQDFIEVEQHETIKMKGISRQIKIFSVKGRKNRAKVKRATDKKKPNMQEISEIEGIKKDMSVMKKNIEDINPNLLTTPKK